MFPLEKEYAKNTGITPEDIAQFRQWLKTQPHLPEEHITDLDLILAYHCCNKSMGVAKQVLDLHYTLRTMFTTFFKNRLYDDKIELTLQNNLIAPLPMRNKDGDKIIYYNFYNPDPKVFIFSEVIKAVLMVLDVIQYNEGTYPGIQIVVDFTGMTMAHLGKIEIQAMQQYIYYLQEALQLKLKGYHFMNAPNFIDKLLAMMKPFMKKELLDIFYTHVVGSNTLEKFIPLEALPKEAGGQYKTLQECRDEVIELMRANKNFFIEENKKRVNESLRPGKPKTITDIFDGVEGSFKKLEVD